MLNAICVFIGFVAGLFFYSKVLDKPETQYNGEVDIKIKQKKGRFRNLFKRNS